MGGTLLRSGSRTARRAGAPVLVLALLAFVAASPASGTAPPPARSASTMSIRLSNDRDTTRWATPVRLADIHRHPSGRSQRVGRLRFLTEDGFPEVYLLLRQHTDVHGRQWVRLRIPRRPNGRLGWVPRDALGPYEVVHTRLVVDERALTVTLYRGARRLFRAHVGIGKPSTPTPRGRFWIREKFRFRSSPVYGTYAMGTSAYAPHLTDWPGGGVVGMHGTDEPGLIPGRPSHGCIRLRNAAIARLWRLTPVGTPLRIE